MGTAAFRQTIQSRKGAYVCRAGAGVFARNIAIQGGVLRCPDAKLTPRSRCHGLHVMVTTRGSWDAVMGWFSSK